jgi:hypothetical protein
VAEAAVTAGGRGGGGDVTLLRPSDAGATVTAAPASQGLRLRGRLAGVYEALSY